MTQPTIPVPKTPPPRDRWLRPHEAERLLDGCQAAHVRLFVLLALHTAARSGALLSLPWSRVDLTSRRIDLGAAVGRKGRAIVAVNDALFAELVQAHAGRTGGHVIETAAGEPVASVKTGFRAAVRRSGLLGVTPHTLRHTAATWMAQAGVPMRDIAGVLGHRDTRTTERVYAHHHPDYQLGAMAALSAALPGQRLTGLVTPSGISNRRRNGVAVGR